MDIKVYKTRALKGEKQTSLNFSQGMVSGFNLEKYQASKIAFIGAGAIGSHAALGLVRKGVGVLSVFDDDKVELKNLTRQLFSTKDVDKNKAVCLARMLSKQGFFKTSIKGYPYRFQEAIEMNFDFTDCDAVICAVDNNPTRIAVARYCLKHKIPLIINAVSRDGNQMYCAIQEPGRACFGCILTHAINDDSYPCNLPGIIDIIQVVSGITVYALDTLLMHRHREWNYKSITLDGFMPDASVTIPKRVNCLICG